MSGLSVLYVVALATALRSKCSRCCGTWPMRLRLRRVPRWIPDHGVESASLGLKDIREFKFPMEESVLQGEAFDLHIPSRKKFRKVRRGRAFADIRAGPKPDSAPQVEGILEPLGSGVH